MFPLALLSPALFSNPSTLTETVVSDVYFFAFTSLLNKSWASLSLEKQL
uniref:Uncharacterized protein n=1 Tax=Rhizophora mucronata TaxID=61149 RepID=A0A2P2JRJ7_RHIMU